MTKSPWTIDAKNRTASHSSGATVEFNRVGTDWTASLQKPEVAAPGFLLLDAKALEREALKIWTTELMSALHLLTIVGKALHGNEWIAPLAKDLDINRISIQRWLKQENPLTMGHPIWNVIRQVVATQRDALQAIDVQIKEAMAGAEELTGKRYAGNGEPREPA